ncbi:MAG TPA: hypothetical protein VEH04_06895 [Verrucomicrobiae bacterium]|nr:hypothetical protein [Verrucomicrobiae bacterium]
MQFPFFVREDFGHGKQMVRADTPDEARKIPLREFTRPVAVELIDSSSPTDKLYRKYRYVVAGDFGVAHHLQVSHGWITRGRNRVVNDITRSEELNYINAPCGLHPAFQKAKRALGLDFVAFDYSLDHRGMPIIWEANPYPSIHFSKRDLVYRNEAVHRTIAIVVASYFRAAAVDMPSELAAYLSAENSISCSGCLPIADHPVPSWKTPPTRPKTRWPALRFPFFSRRAAAGESNNMARPKAD